MLNKIRNWPDARKKAVFWLIIIAVATSLFYLYGRYIAGKIQEMRGEELGDEFQVQKLDKGLRELFSE